MNNLLLSHSVDTVCKRFMIHVRDITKVAPPVEGLHQSIFVNFFLFCRLRIVNNTSKENYSILIQRTRNYSFITDKNCNPFSFPYYVYRVICLSNFRFSV